MTKFQQFIKKILGWLDPKLDKFRDPVPPPNPADFTPKTLKDLVTIIKNTPADVLSDKEKDTIAYAVTFADKKVRDVMLKKSEMTFVFEQDFLGPLMLDKLYRSGFSHFPVMSYDGKKIVGMIHTASLNRLEVRDTDRATKYLDPTVYYVRDDYTMEQVLAAFLRTNSHFLVVINSIGQVAGLVTYEMVTAYIIGDIPEDNFEQDGDLDAVAKRVLPVKPITPPTTAPKTPEPLPGQPEQLRRLRKTP